MKFPYSVKDIITKTQTFQHVLKIYLQTLSAYAKIISKPFKMFNVLSLHFLLSPRFCIQRSRLTAYNVAGICLDVVVKNDFLSTRVTSHLRLFTVDTPGRTHTTFLHVANEIGQCLPPIISSLTTWPSAATIGLGTFQSCLAWANKFLSLLRLNLFTYWT